jgi:hypothetical protein
VVSLPKLEISRVGESGNQLRISFDSVNGKKYQFESTDNISPSVWTNVGSALTGNGSKLSITNTVTTQKHKFFRLKLSQ